jgi:hypothetical protein
MPPVIERFRQPFDGVLGARIDAHERRWQKAQGRAYVDDLAGTMTIRVVLIEPPYIRTNLDASAAQAEDRIDDYAAQRRCTAAAVTRDTNAAPEPKVVVEEVLRSIEGSYRMRRPIGRATLLSWLRRLLPAGMFEQSLRKAFALGPSSRGAVTERRTRA